MAFEKEKNKLILEKCQSILTELLKDEDNKYCVDCDAKSPRWAAWNIGIFLCIRCAGIHRNLGVHISRVKSVNLDSWTPQQVACIQQMGNSKARAVYEANLQDNFRRPQTDSSLEQFIRAKYEAKKYIAREWVPSDLPNPTWDIELEKQLKRKRDKKTTSGNIEFPAHVKSTVNKITGSPPKPLPKAPGGKSSSLNIAQTKNGTTINKISEKKVSSGTEDLLGLEVGPQPSATTTTTDSNDIFGDFLAAPSIPSSTFIDSKAIDVKEEESKFFNQKQQETTNEKMSKDSILALYSKTPQQPLPLGNHSGGMMLMGGGIPIVPSGVPMMHPQQSNGLLQQQHNAMIYQQQPVMNNMMGGMQQHQRMNHFVGTQLSAANPFSQMQQQMGGLSLGGVAAPNPSMMGPAAKSDPNTWQ